MNVKQLNVEGYIEIQLVTFGESFQFGSYVMEVITIPGSLREAADSAIRTGWVPRMVRLSDGTCLLMMFAKDTLVMWLGYTND